MKRVDDRMAALPFRSERGVLVSKSPQRGRRFELWGWLLFVVSALFFIVSSVRAGDVVGLLGGVFFLLACIAFLAAYIDPAGRGGRGR